MIDKISFQNYKIFRDWQELELRPLTILIGKNSSGKSVLTKLPTMIEGALSGAFEEPLLLNNGGVEIGGEFRDLVYGRFSPFSFSMRLQAGSEKLEVTVASGANLKDYPKILKWKLEGVEGAIEAGLTDEFRGVKLRKGGSMLPGSDFSLRTDYLGPFRSIPKRINVKPNLRNVDKLGVEGENVYPLLYLDSIERSETSLLRRIDHWYRENFEGWGIRVNRDRDPYYEIELTWNGKLNINIADVGQGMSQVLPLVARAMMPVDEPLLIILEQPELHIHPGAHGNLAQLFAESTLDNQKRKYLIETHSKTFVMRLRRLVAEGKIAPQDLAIYHVEFDEGAGSGELTKLEVDQEGRVRNWPEHVFSEALDEAIALRSVQINLTNDAH